MDAVKYTRNCLQCSFDFLPKRKDSFFCSESCRSKYHRANRKARNIANEVLCDVDGCNAHVYLKGKCHRHYSASKYIAKHPKEKQCLNCNKTFIGTGQKKFCSIKCCSTYRLRKLGVKPAHRIAKTTCKGCGKEFQPRKTEFSTYCSRECFFTTQKKVERTYNEKVALQTYAKRRRQRMKSNGYERINKIKVFERDKWICHICGIKTPKYKRGTLEMDAPELDHIVPIAAGGSHTYSNVACCCKRCNIRKSTKPLGQLNFGII